MPGEFIRDELLNLEDSLHREYLDTNGIGGYASSTLLDCHTRKYHGLLVASLPELGGRFVLLSKMDSSIMVGKKEFYLCTTKYPGVYYPTGHQFLEKVETDPVPSSLYRIGDILLRKSVAMVQGENTVLIRYELIEAGKPIRLRLRPQMAYRGIHELQASNMSVQVKVFGEDKKFKIQPYNGMPEMVFQSNTRSSFFAGPCWNFNIEYLKERSRGFPYQEDTFCPGVFEKRMREGEVFVMRVSTKSAKGTPVTMWKKEIKRREDLSAAIDEKDFRLKRIREHSGDFIIKNGRKETSIVAGYHWFAEWGRDAMIALPGLTFRQGKIAEGEAVLKTFAKHQRDGLIPNFLGEGDREHAYNSIDASLWYFWAVQEYELATGKPDLIYKNCFKQMGMILEALVEGRANCARVREDGLFECGDPHTQLTWMDAQAYGRPVTPRWGMPVEINALWYNALKYYIKLAEDLGRKINPVFAELAKKFEQNFESRFRLSEEGGLADVVRDDYVDMAIRPNQIFAVSLPFCALSKEACGESLKVVEQHLLTPCGMRTLSPRNPDYRIECHGNPDERDSAYHQGTVWPWLMGHYVEAVLKHAANPEKKAKELSLNFTPLIEEHLDDFGVFSIAEIFDGNPPHKARGCIAQAWSVAELLRAFELLKGYLK